jgi:protein SCO1/2
VLVAATLTLAAACGGGDAPAYSGIVRDPPPVVDVEPVPDASDGGRPMRLRGDPGGLLLVYFGYTFCPDVCPTTMADLRTALGKLDGEQADRVDVAMVTIDPGRDDGEALTRYVQAFIADGHAISTADARLLHRVASRFGAGYEVATGPDGETEVSHTAFLYAVDEKGRLVLQWPFRTPPDALRSDLDALLDTTSTAS